MPSAGVWWGGKEFQGALEDDAQSEMPSEMVRDEFEWVRPVTEAPSTLNWIRQREREPFHSACLSTRLGFFVVRDTTVDFDV